MTPTQEAQTYIDICRAECEHCRRGTEAEDSPFGRKRHWVNTSTISKAGSYFGCTAPTRDQAIRCLSADLAAERENEPYYRVTESGRVEANTDRRIQEMLDTEAPKEKP